MPLIPDRKTPPPVAAKGSRPRRGAAIGPEVRIVPDEPAPVERPDKATTIIVNARPQTVTTEELTFDELVDLAFDDPARGPLIVFTITFRNAHGRLAEGELDPDHRLKVREGTIVNVTRTDQS